MEILNLTTNLSLKRTLESGNDEQLKAVREIIAQVRKNGDKAVRTYTEKWDGIYLSSNRVTEAEMERAVNAMDAQIMEDLKEAAANITKYHEQQNDKDPSYL